MPHGQQGKARRREQRKQQRAAEKRRNRQAPPNSKAMEESGGWLSMIWGSGESETESGVSLQGDEDLSEDTTLATFGHQESEQEGGDEGGGSWWDYVPSWSWGAKEEREGYGDRRGNDDNHIDMLSDKSTRKLGLEVGVEGVQAEAELERTRKMVDIVGKAEGEVGPLKGELGTGVALGHATANAKAKGSLSGQGIQGEGEIGGGLYAASAEAEGKLGLKVPFLNARLMAEGSLGGNVGVGGKAEGKFKADSSGFQAGGKVGATVGVGGQVGWGFGVTKDDPKKGWLE